MTQPEEGDPLAASYGDSPLIASKQRSSRVWTPVHALTPELKDQKVYADKIEPRTLTVRHSETAWLKPAQPVKEVTA